MNIIDQTRPAETMLDALAARGHHPLTAEEEATLVALFTRATGGAKIHPPKDDVPREKRHGYWLLAFAAASGPHARAVEAAWPLTGRVYDPVR